MSIDPSSRVNELAELVGWQGEGDCHIDWPAIEGALGLGTPRDYKELLARFPPGEFNGSLVAFDFPEPANPLGGFALQLDDYRDWRADEPERFPFPLYPEPGGVLPWGGSGRGDTFFWITDPERSPDEWGIVAVDSEVTHWRRFPGNATDFIIAAITGELEDGHLQYGAVGQPQFRAFPDLDEEDDEEDAATYDPWSVHPAIEPLLADMPAPQDEVGKLLALIPRSADGGGVASRDWPALEEELGTSLPSDYKECIDSFGVGTFLDIRILEPEATVAVHGIAVAARELSGALKDRFALTERERGERIRPPVFPEARGMIPWGVRGDGLRLVWIPSSESPDEWFVAAIPPDLISRKMFHDKSMTGFLVSYLTEPRGRVFGDLRASDGAPTFRPATSGDS